MNGETQFFFFRTFQFTATSEKFRTEDGFRARAKRARQQQLSLGSPEEIRRRHDPRRAARKANPSGSVFQHDPVGPERLDRPRPRNDLPVAAARRRRRRVALHGLVRREDRALRSARGRRSLLLGQEVALAGEADGVVRHLREARVLERRFEYSSSL